MTGLTIEVDRLTKRFGKTVAVDDVSFAVPTGTVLGLLGPNGAGKTTTINCLTTLLRPDGGRAVVAGHDVVEDPAGVRSSIALTGQFAAVDEVLTGRQNLVLFGRLLRMGRRTAQARAAELLEQFDLSDGADKAVKEYSGGMRRRLDLAASLMVPRPVLVLDEPTTGLDPRSRQTMWAVVRDLRSTGSTVLLTTQYLEEADQLADEIVVIDQGTVIAAGTSDELKDRVGGSMCEVHIEDERTRARAVDVLAATMQEVTHNNGSITLAGATSRTVSELIRCLDDAGIEANNVALRRPTLDDVFFTLTGHGTEAEVRK
jgi:ABC-2 type transport system ATP-binding protein